MSLIKKKKNTNTMEIEIISQDFIFPRQDPPLCINSSLTCCADKGRLNYDIRFSISFVMLSFSCVFFHTLASLNASLK